jgi:signal peptidase I
MPEAARANPRDLASPSPPASRLRRAARFAERCLAVTGALLLVYHAGFDLSEVVSSSMAPTLVGEADRADNDWILTERLSTRLGPPPRFHVVVFRGPEGDTIAKRVVGYPGERLRVVDGSLEVDGALQGEGQGAPPVRYLRAGRLRPREDGPEVHEVGPDAVFVLGDHQADSWDSRFFGDLPRERWRGRVVAVVWPPSRWQWLW